MTPGPSGPLPSSSPQAYREQLFVATDLLICLFSVWNSDNRRRIDDNVISETKCGTGDEQSHGNTADSSCALISWAGVWLMGSQLMTTKSARLCLAGRFNWVSSSIRPNETSHKTRLFALNSYSFASGIPFVWIFSLETAAFCAVWGETAGKNQQRRITTVGKIRK